MPAAHPVSRCSFSVPGFAGEVMAHTRYSPDCMRDVVPGSGSVIFAYCAAGSESKEDSLVLYCGKVGPRCSLIRCVHLHA